MPVQAGRDDSPVFAAHYVAELGTDHFPYPLLPLLWGGGLLGGQLHPLP